jgi:hypothetical protein
LILLSLPTAARQIKPRCYPVPDETEGIATRRDDVELLKIPLKDIVIDPMAEVLVKSKEARPYFTYFIKAYSKDAASVKSALQVLQDLPLEKRYTWRVFSALKWALADFDDECVRLDLPHIPEPKKTEMVKELELRFRQLKMLKLLFGQDVEIDIEPRAEPGASKHANVNANDAA